MSNRPRDNSTGANVAPTAAGRGDPPAGEITQSLRALRARWRLYAALSGTVRLIIAIVLTSLLQLLLDRWFKLAVDQRAVLNAALTIFWLWLAYRFVVAAMLTPLTDQNLAGVVDGANSDLHDRFATAVQFAAGEVGDARSNSPQLVEAAIVDARREAQRVSFTSVLNHRRAAQRGAELGGIAVVLLLAFVIMSDIMPTWFARNWMLRDVPWPQRTRLIPLGFEQNRQRLPRGDELEIVAWIEGEVPRSKSADIIWRSPSGRSGRETMTLVADQRFAVNLGLLSEDVSFRLVGGDERTREFTVEAAERPNVTRLFAHVEPPAYTGLEPFDVDRQSFLKLLSGSTVQIDAQTNKPIAQARLTAGDGRELPCEIAGDSGVRVKLNAPQSGVYRFDLTDRDGWTSRRPVRVTLKVEQDSAPTVRMVMTGVGDFVTSTARLSIDLNIDDSYGLASAKLFSQRGESDPHATALAGFSPTMREFATHTQFDISTSGAQAGDRVRVWAQAADRYPLGPNFGQSPQVELRVLSREDFLNEMARREYALRQEFERLLTGQRILKDSLERLSGQLSDAQPPDMRISQRLATLARRQNQHARRCLVIRGQFSQLLAELWTSRVAGAAVDRRITDGIVTPMGELARDAMPAAAAAISALRSSTHAQQRQTALTRQNEVLHAMRAILAGMLKSEGFREAVELLRQIIDEQSGLRAETLEALDGQIRNILGGEDPPTGKDDPTRPKP